MKLKDKLGYIPLLIVDAGYSEHIYGSDGMALPIIQDEDFIIRRQFNREVIKKLIEKANNLGFAVLDVAPETYDISLDTRINRANANFSAYYRKYVKVSEEKLALYIALQYDPKACNWDDSDDKLRVNYLHNDSNSKDLASLINDQLIKAFGEFNGSIKASKQYILKQSTMSAVLIDASFMDLKEKLDWMYNEDFIDEVSKGILTGCLNYFGIKNIGVINSKIEIKNYERIKKLQEKADSVDKRLLLCEETIANLKKHL